MAHEKLAWLFLEPDTGFNHCPRTLLSCFRAMISVPVHADVGVDLLHDLVDEALVVTLLQTSLL